ncbi:hypothetical protein BE11_01180 [Sorangium cellulosum]|nr:hypothetical protein BE11_01180 [Sorangium cellulosum]
MATPPPGSGTVLHATPGSNSRASFSRSYSSPGMYDSGLRRSVTVPSFATTRSSEDRKRLTRSASLPTTTSRRSRSRRSSRTGGAATSEESVTNSPPAHATWSRPVEASYAIPRGAGQTGLRRISLVARSIVTTAPPRRSAT